MCKVFNDPEVQKRVMINKIEAMSNKDNASNISNVCRHAKVRLINAEMENVEDLASWGKSGSQFKNNAITSDNNDIRNTLLAIWKLSESFV